MKSHLIATFAAAASAMILGLFARTAQGEVYLNIDNISVAVGGNTSPGTFNNTFSFGQTIDKVIDAATAETIESHTQTTHIWFTSSAVGGGLELEFDFKNSFDLSTLHFWNYTGETYDVDNVNIEFFNESGTNVGAFSFEPLLGISDPSGIAAQDIAVDIKNVRTATAFLSGSNRQIDFQNIGFTANVTAIPEPTCFALLSMTIPALLLRRCRS